MQVLESMVSLQENLQRVEASKKGIHKQFKLVEKMVKGKDLEGNMEKIVEANSTLAENWCVHVSTR